MDRKECLLPSLLSFFTGLELSEKKLTLYDIIQIIAITWRYAMKKFERIAVMLVLSIIFTLFSPYGVYAEEETLPADARYHIVDY